MDQVESQQRPANVAVSAAFGTWLSHHVHFEEFHGLRGNLQNKIEELQRLQQSISSVDAVHQENQQLKEELRTWRSQSGPVPSRRRYNELENERDVLLKENRLKQRTIDTLQSIVRYEKLKSKDWSRYSISSPAPPVSGCRSSPHQPTEADRELDTAPSVDMVSPLCSQPLFQKLTPSLKNMQSQVKFPKPLTQTCGEQHNRTVSVKSFTGQDALSPQPSAEVTEYLNCSISFPGFDTTRSQQDSFSDLQAETSPRPQLSAAVLRLIDSSLSNEHSNCSIEAFFQSDSMASLSQSCRKHVDSEDKQPHNSYSDLEMAVSARTAGRSKQKSAMSAAEAEIGSGNTGNAEEAIRVTREQSETIRKAADATSCMMPTAEGSLKETISGSPRRKRDPQIRAALGSVPILYVTKNEMLGLKKNHTSAQPFEAFSPRKDDEISSEFPEFVHAKSLQEIKNDKLILPRTGNASSIPVKERKSTDGRRATEIPAIMEDSEDENQIYRRIAGKLPKPTFPARSDLSSFQRLGHFIEGPSPAMPVLTEPSTHPSKVTDMCLLDATTKSVKKNEIHGMRFSENNNWECYESAQDLLQSVDLQRLSQPEKMPVQVLPESYAATQKPQHEPQQQLHAIKRKLLNEAEDEPFRSRSVQRLNLDHFKINTEANAGVDYAYIEVIRNQDQRKCLPSCIRPECCGSKFRAIADTLLELTRNSGQSLGAELSDEACLRQSDDDLYNVLGPIPEERIRTLTYIARENLLEIKTKILADKYGKMHRHAHKRLKSPPGFWRTEMLGTQEEAVDQFNVKKREREEVEMRYREACREGGRWKFADE